MTSFDEFSDVVVGLLVEHPVINFDIWLSIWLTKQDNVTFANYYRLWRQEPVNLHKDFTLRIRHLLSCWHQEHGHSATPIKFLNILKGKPQTQALIDRIIEYLGHVEPGTKYCYKSIIEFLCFAQSYYRSR